MNEEEDWTITYADGSTESVYGRLTIADGAVWITQRERYGGHVREQHAYPLTALRKWEHR